MSCVGRSKDGPLQALRRGGKEAFLHSSWKVMHGYAKYCKGENMCFYHWGADVRVKMSVKGQMEHQDCLEWISGSGFRLPGNSSSRCWAFSFRNLKFFIMWCKKKPRHVALVKHYYSLTKWATQFCEFTAANCDDIKGPIPSLLWNEKGLKFVNIVSNETSTLILTVESCAVILVLVIPVPVFPVQVIPVQVVPVHVIPVQVIPGQWFQFKGFQCRWFLCSWFLCRWFQCKWFQCRWFQCQWLQCRLFKFKWIQCSWLPYNWF